VISLPVARNQNLTSKRLSVTLRAKLMRTLYALNKVAGRQAGYREEEMNGDIVEVESKAGSKGFITADSLLATLRKKNGNVP
jgi:hypothetical protein